MASEMLVSNRCITQHKIPEKNNLCGLKVSENRVLRRKFGSKRQEVVGGWSRLHNEELQNLYTSPNIIRVIRPRRMRWAGYVACMGKMTTQKTKV
jgi:hypothetical protein